MTTTTIAGLPASTIAALTDSLPVDQADGVTRHETLQQIETLLAPIVAASQKTVTSVAVNSSNQVVVGFNDGSSQVAGTVGTAAVPSAGLVSSTGTVLTTEALDPTLSNASGTLAVASSVTSNLATARSEADGALGGASVTNGTLTLTHVAVGSPIVIPIPAGAQGQQGIQGIQGIQGPAGTLGSGDASANVAEAYNEGPARSLANALLDHISPMNFGATRSGNFVTDAAGLGSSYKTRAQIAAYVSPSGGGKPYAWISKQPFPDGTSDLWFHIVPQAGTGLVGTGGTASAPTVDLHAHYVTTQAGYVGSDGHYYIPIPPLHPSIATGQAVSGGTTSAGAGTTALASGTTVVGLGTYRVQISAQPTTVVNGNTVYPTTGKKVPIMIGSITVLCRNGSYFDGTNWWIDLPNPGENLIEEMVVIGGGLAAGTAVVSTFGNCIRVTDQPSSTTNPVPVGTSLDIGADMTKVAVGQSFWLAEGLSPLTTITATSGSVVTLSAALTSSGGTGGLGLTYGNAVAYTGPKPMMQACIFNALLESNLGGVLHMDSLALLAAHYACPYSGGIELDEGTWSINSLVCIGGNVSWHAAPGCVIQGTQGGVMIKLFPQPGSDIEVCRLRLFNNVLANVGVEIDCIQWGFYAQNLNGGSSCNFHQCKSYGAAKDAFRLVNVGNVKFHDMESTGFGSTATYGTSCRLVNVVLMLSFGCNTHNCWKAFRQTGYTEDVICRDHSHDQVGRGYDMEDSSTFNGFAALLFKWSGGDNDCITSTVYAKRVLEINLHDCEVSCSNPPGAGSNTVDAYVLAGCDTGVATALMGGAAGTSGSCVHLTSAMLDGTYVGCDKILVTEIEVNGFAHALLIDTLSSNNAYGSLLLAGSTTNAVLDNGSSNLNLGIPSIYYADPGNILYVGNIAAQNLTTTFAALVLNTAYAIAATPWNATTYTYTVKQGGFFAIEILLILADTGTAASGSFNAASASGTRFQAKIALNGATIVAMSSTTGPVSTTQYFKYRVYAPANTAITILVRSDAAGLLSGGYASIEETLYTY